MLDKYYRILSHENLIEENLDVIINAYVDFYGEDKREYITNKLKNTTYITYLNLHDLYTTIMKMKKIKSGELLDRIKHELDGYFSFEEFNQLFNYEEYDIFLIHEYYVFIDKIRNGETVKNSSNLTYFDSNITKENIVSGHFDEKMVRLNKIRPLIEELNIEYNNFLIYIEKQEKALNDADELKEKLEKKQWSTLLSNLKII